MSELPALATASIAVGVPLVALGAVGWSDRWRGRLALVLAGLALLTGALVGVAQPVELLDLARWTGLTDPAVELLVWTAFTASAGVAVRRLPPGPPLLVAALTGAALGELGAAVVLASLAPAGPGRARLVLAAAGGALAVRVGDPGALVVLSGAAPLLALLGLLSAVVVLPRAADLPTRGEGSLGPWLLAAGLSALAALVPALGIYALAAGSVAFGVIATRQRQRVGLRHLLWTLGSVVLVVMVSAAGLPEAAAFGLETVQELPGRWTSAALSACGVLLGLLLDGPAAGLFTRAVLDRGLELHLDDAAVALAAGVGVGGLGPLVVGGCLRQGWWRLLLQALVVVGVLAVAS